MNKPTKSFLQEYLDDLKKLLARLRGYEDRFTKYETDKAAFSAEIEKLSSGSMRYDDDEAIDRLHKLEFKSKLLEKAESDEGEKYAAYATATVVPFLTQGCAIVQSVLIPVYERRLETVAAVMRPFSRTEADARRQAERSDSCQAAWQEIRSFGGGGQKLNSIGSTGRQDTVTFLKLASTIDQILTEAIKPVPDLMQFIDIEFTKDSPRQSEGG